MYYLGIETFMVVVQTQNLSQAAKQLNLAQSTVSKRLQLLEQELGILLIERGKGNKAFRLTAAGESFFDLATRWQSLWKETQNFHSSIPQLTLSIGVLLSMSYTVFPGLFQNLSQHKPILNLKVLTRPTSQLYDLLEHGEIDVAFTNFPRAHPHIIVEKYRSDIMVGLCKPTAAYARAQTIHPHDLDGCNELFVKFGLIHQAWHDQWWKPVCPGRTNLDTTHLIPLFFSNDQQWAIVPFSIAKYIQKQGDYHIFHITEPPPDWTCFKTKLKYPTASTKKALDILDYYLDKLESEKELL